MKDDIKINHVNLRQFNYEKGGMKLNFTLNVDNLAEVEAFKSLMILATEEIDTIVNPAIKNK